MSTICIFSKTFKNPSTGWEAFTLFLKKIDEEIYFLDSDILPISILTFFNHLIDSKYIYDKESGLIDCTYLNDLISITGEYILKEEKISRFFYPNSFLNEDFELDIKKINLFNDAKNEVQNNRNSFIDENQPFHLLYINQLFQLPKPIRNRSFYKKQRINKEKFEAYISTILQGQSYVNIYSHSIRFKMLSDRRNNDLLACCFDQNNRVVFAIDISN